MVLKQLDQFKLIYWPEIDPYALDHSRQFSHLNGYLHNGIFLVVVERDAYCDFESHGTPANLV